MLGSSLPLKDYLARLSDELNRLDRTAIERWSDLIYEAWDSGQCVFVIGNGGAATTASHFAEDFGKSLLHVDELQDESRKRLKVLSLTDNAGRITALGNDLSFDEIFVQQLMNLGGAGDVLIALSGSGNSRNILRAVEWANRHGLRTFGMTGYDGGHLKRIQQDGIHIDVADMGMTQSIHLCLFHWVLDDLYARIHCEGRYSPAD
ncbi:MAG: SIS domain-containing protein [Planctomycetaceae bacterium]